MYLHFISMLCYFILLLNYILEANIIDCSPLLILSFNFGVLPKLYPQKVLFFATHRLQFTPTLADISTVVLWQQLTSREISEREQDLCFWSNKKVYLCRDPFCDVVRHLVTKLLRVKISACEWKNNHF